MAEVEQRLTQMDQSIQQEQDEVDRLRRQIVGKRVSQPTSAMIPLLEDAAKAGEAELAQSVAAGERCEYGGEEGAQQGQRVDGDVAHREEEREPKGRGEDCGRHGL